MIRNQKNEEVIEPKKEMNDNAKMYGLRRVALFENIFEDKDEKGNIKKSIVYYMKKTIFDDKTEQYKEVKGFYLEDLQNLRVLIDAVLFEHINRK